MSIRLVGGHLCGFQVLAGVKHAAMCSGVWQRAAPPATEEPGVVPTTATYAGLGVPVNSGARWGPGTRGLLREAFLFNVEQAGRLPQEHWKCLESFSVATTGHMGAPWHLVGKTSYGAQHGPCPTTRDHPAPEVTVLRVNPCRRTCQRMLSLPAHLYKDEDGAALPVSLRGGLRDSREGPGP